MITEEHIKAVALHSDVLKDIKSRASRTESMRARIFASLELAREYFAQHGEDGVKQLLISANSVADSNQLHFLSTLTPARAVALLIGYQTLIASNGATTGEAELSEIETILVNSLYWAELLNTHEDSPYNQTPVFPLAPNLETGEVIVNEPNPES